MGALPQEVPQCPNSANVADYVLILGPQTAGQNEDMFRGLYRLCSGCCANYVPGDVRWLHDDRDCDDESGLLRWGTPT